MQVTWIICRVLHIWAEFWDLRFSYHGFSLEMSKQYLSKDQNPKAGLGTDFWIDTDTGKGESSECYRIHSSCSPPVVSQAPSCLHHLFAPPPILSEESLKGERVQNIGLACNCHFCRCRERATYLLVHDVIAKGSCRERRKATRNQRIDCVNCCWSGNKHFCFFPGV